jgi:sporulation protein YlmC with PRC-barrel domain
MMDFKDWQGKAVLDRDGHKIGSIGQLYVDDRNNAPAWATVRNNDGENFFPVSMAHVQGDDIIVDMPEDEVKQAPHIEADEQLNMQEEQELFEYYRKKWGTTDESQSMVSSDATDDTSTDATMRSDDNSDNNAHMHLRKYTVTELVSDNGDVQHKEVIIEREPIDENMLSGTTDSDKMDAWQENRQNDDQDRTFDTEAGNQATDISNRNRQDSNRFREQFEDDETMGRNDHMAF